MVFVGCFLIRLDVACELGNVSCLDVLLERCADIVSVSKAGKNASC